MGRNILTVLAISAFGLVACRSSTYYEAMDTVGYEKREMLVDRVEDARDAQVQAKQQLQTALYTLRRVETVPANELGELHGDLKNEVESTSDELDDLRDSISSVESVAESLFADWEEELATFESDELRRQSRQELQRTRESYRELVTALRNTEQRLQTAVPSLEEQVLFIEHAVNAGGTPVETEELDDVREQVSSLIEELEGSIDRTQKFIDEGVEAEV